MNDTEEDILKRGFDEYREFVNPLIAERAKLAGEPFRIMGVENGRLREKDGLVFDDFHGTQAFGHKNPHIVEAMKRFLDSDAASWYPSRVNPFGGRLARRLCERSGYYDNAFFGCTGSDAVEAALKLARALTKRPVILGLDGAYHGCSFGSVSLMAKGYLRDPFGPFLEGARLIPFGDIDALKAALVPGDVAAVVVEPIQGEGGVRELPSAYLEALCDLTERHGTLLVADEVQTALGRTGRGFLGTQHWPRRPDAVLLAKHLGGGLMPLSAMLTKRDLFERAYGAHFASGEAHNTTMGFNALSCVAGLAALDLLTEDLIAKVRDDGLYLKKALKTSLERLSLFREVRGAGFMLGISLKTPSHPWLSFEHFGFPELAHHSAVSPVVCHRLYRRGFYCFTCGHDWSVFRIQPRFDIARERLDTFVGAVAEEIARVEELS